MPTDAFRAYKDRAAQIMKECNASPDPEERADLAQVAKFWLEMALQELRAFRPTLH